jgi:putative flavoprotein involved in K+ transport
LSEHVDTLVVGGGQAGLSASYALTRRGIEHAVLERGRVGQTWRAERWDSFTLNTPNWAQQLPGYAYAGPDPDGFAPLGEVIEYLEGYAASFEAPVREGVEVTALRAGAGGGFELETSAGPLRARTVIVATGAYQRPTPSPLRDAAPASVFQQHTAEYRSPDELPEGAVLVVGSGQSGCQVAEDLVDAGRTVYLSVGACPWVPRTHRGRDLVHWMIETGLMDQTVDSLPSPDALVACNPAVSGTERGHDCNPVTLTRRGVIPVGRLEGFHGGSARFAGDLAANVARGCEFEATLRQRFEEHASATGADPLDEPSPETALPELPELRELALADLGAIVWATGFRPDYSWIDLPVLGDAGRPLQRRGVTDVPGLGFVGVHWLHTRKSSLFLGVGEDAEHLVAQLSSATRVP